MPEKCERCGDDGADGYEVALRKIGAKHKRLVKHLCLFLCSRCATDDWGSVTDLYADPPPEVEATGLGSTLASVAHMDGMPP